MIHKRTVIAFSLHYCRATRNKSSWSLWQSSKVFLCCAYLALTGIDDWAFFDTSSGIANTYQWYIYHLINSTISGESGITTVLSLGYQSKQYPTSAPLRIGLYMQAYTWWRYYFLPKKNIEWADDYRIHIGK